MIKIACLSIFLPILVLIVSVLLDLGMILHFLVVWPLSLVELTGVMGNNPEGFYNNWYAVSIAFSLMFLSTVIFAYLIKRRSRRVKRNGI